MTLPAIAHDMLRGLYAHRLLSTDQLHDLYGGRRSRRWTLVTLANLRAGKYIGRCRVAGSRQFAWFLQPNGVAITEGPGVERRSYRMTPERAAGPLQAHTLVVNEVGRLFARAAAARGDQCGPGDWRNETAFRLGPGRGAETLVVDAVLDYTLYSGSEGTYLCRFVEVDRATTSVRTLVAKLEAYAALWAYAPSWRGYPKFPTVMVVMAGAAPAVLERRLDALEAMLRLSSPVAGCPDLQVSVATLDALRRHGPFGPVFWRPGRAGPVDLLGTALASTLSR